MDGDCIPSFEFVENHRQLAESGWVVNGQRVLASEAFTQQLVSQQQIPQEWTYSYFKNLATQQSVNRAFPVITTKQTWFRKLQKTKWERIQGCNFALWKSDYLAVNGSDESFQGWGSEDKDLVVRLLNHGCFIKSGQLVCCVLHLWHNEAKRNNAEKNLNIVKERRLKKVALPKVGMK